jgi:hypothetical protein
MLFMVEATFPLKNTAEASKAFAEAMAKPQTHINRIGMWMAYGGDGMKTWFVCEIDKEHDEGFKELGSRYTSYFNVEGYKVSIIPIIKPEEAIALLGASLQDRT